MTLKKSRYIDDLRPGIMYTGKILYRIRSILKNRYEDEETAKDSILRLLYRKTCYKLTYSIKKGFEDNL